MTFPGPAFYDQHQVFEVYTRHCDDPAAPNHTLEGPLIRSLLGDVQGHDFPDLGCGAGAFGKELLAAGAASYLGVDGSRNMVGRAEATLQGSAGRVILGDLRDWGFPAAA